MGLGVVGLWISCGGLFERLGGVLCVWLWSLGMMVGGGGLGLVLVVGGVRGRCRLERCCMSACRALVGLVLNWAFGGGGWRTWFSGWGAVVVVELGDSAFPVSVSAVWSDAEFLVEGVGGVG
jgi:hypothetical protein